MDVTITNRSFDEMNLSAETLSSLDNMGYRAPTVMIDLINGKKVADPLYTGLDECVPTNLDKCPAK